jgi:hypothetical protein
MKRALFAVLLLALSLPAAAQPYVFGLFTLADADTRVTPDTSGSESTRNLGAGWRFSKYFSAELGHLSTVHLSSADRSTQFKIKGVGIAAVGTWPLSSDWALVGKLGAYDLDGDTYRLDSTFTCCTSQTSSDLGTRPLFAFGAQYRVNDSIYAQALYQQISGKDGSELDTLRLLSLGAVLQF